MNPSTEFRGYQLPHFLNDMEMSLFLSKYAPHLYDIGKQNLDDIRQQIESFTRLEEQSLDCFLNEWGDIDGTLLQEVWFPDVDVDVFLSHSHRDEDLAIIFAGYLKHELGLDVFIDSCLWGYADNLLRNLDNRYCRKGPHTYSYRMRNQTTTHVHMMLAAALKRTIEQSRCAIVMSTPQMVSTRYKDSRTCSPWIYFEMEVIDGRIPTWRRQALTESFSPQFQMTHRIRLADLPVLTLSILHEWKESAQGKEKREMFRLLSDIVDKHYTQIP